MKTLIRTFALIATAATLNACSAGPQSSIANPADETQNSGSNSGGVSQSVSKIIGGDVVQPTDPIAETVVALYDKKIGALCTASLISNDLIVTAAHCVDGAQPEDLYVIFGQDLTKEGASEAHKVVSFVENPDYPKAGDNDKNFADIAVAKFSGGFPKIGNYKAANLLLNQSKLANGAVVTLAGYGITNGTTQEGAGVLHKVDVKIKDVQWSDHEILLDQTSGKGACHGDSGGPAYVTMNGELYLFGVTSRGVDDPKNDCSQFAAYSNIMAYEAWFLTTTTTLEMAAPVAATPSL